MLIDIKLKDYEHFILLLSNVCSTNGLNEIHKKVLKQFTITAIKYDYSIPKTDEVISIELSQGELLEILYLTEDNSFYEPVYNILIRYAAV